jgi:hypothetical protein
MNIFDAPDFLVLLTLGFPQLFDARVMLDQVVAVVAHVIGERTPAVRSRARHHGIEENRSWRQG